MASATRIDTEVQSDAVPADDDDHGEDLARTQQQATFNRRATTTSQSSAAYDDDIKEKLSRLPPELRDDYIDLLVIHTDADHQKAKEFQELIMRDVKFCGGLTPNVTLLDDILTDFPFHHLDYAFSRSTYILMYVTKHFCQDFHTLAASHTCLIRAFNNPEAKKAIIPVHTCPKEDRDYDLPMMLDNLRPLNKFSRTFTQDVTKLLEHKSDLIWKRKESLEKQRQAFLNKLRDLECEELSKLPVRNAESNYNDNSKSTPSVRDPLQIRIRYPGTEQQLSQLSVSTQPKSVSVTGDIEQDGDVSVGRSRPHTSEVDTKKRVDESGYNSLAGEEPSLNYSSHQGCDGDKTAPTNLPPTHPKIAFNGKQSLPVSVGSDDLQSVTMDTTENKENPSTGDKHARNSASQDCKVKSSNAPAPVYSFHINHADFVDIDSTVTMTRPKIKTAPTNLPPTHPKIAFNGKQSLPVSVGSDDLQSVPMDTTENKENPSTGDKHARNSASQDCKVKSSNAPAPVYSFHINHADFVNIDSTVTMTRSKQIPDTSDAEN